MSITISLNQNPTPFYGQHVGWQPSGWQQPGYGCANTSSNPWANSWSNGNQVAPRLLDRQTGAVYALETPGSGTSMTNGIATRVRDNYTGQTYRLIGFIGNQGTLPWTGPSGYPGYGVYGGQGFFPGM